ncbi:MAG: Uma2 family endonuclease [Pirellulaceae bacterium]
MSTVRQPKLTEAEYLAIERAAPTKSDFYDGEMFAMAGARRNHNLLVANVVGELREQLRKSPCEVYPSDMRVRVGKTGLYTYPDAVVVCGEPEFLDDTQDTLLNPTLLVEVLSESTATYDRGFKSSCYRQLKSLKEYVLIEQEQPRVELYQRSRGKWTLQDAGELTASVTLASIRCTLKLAAVYEKIGFKKQIQQPGPGR